MKSIKLIPLLLLILVTTINFGFAPHNSHQILLQQLEQQNAINKITKLIDENNYEEAFLQLDKIESSAGIEIYQNISNFNKCIANYKKIFLSNVENYLQQNNPDLALLLLQSKQKYYKDDQNITALLASAQMLANKTQYQEFKGNIEVLHFKNILSFPENALDTKNLNYETYDNDHLTPNEFEKILHNLYSNGYILISSQHALSGNHASKLILPKDKKPLILILEHVSYSDNMGGLSDRLILDRSKNIASYTSKKSIANRVNYEKDFVTILEDYISQHPEFSFSGSRAILSFNGDDGILGYKTQNKNITFKAEVKKAKAITQKLKKLGYEFANNGYSAKHLQNISEVDLAKQVTRWKKEIDPILPQTITYQINDTNFIANREHLAKLKFLHDNGYKLFITESEDYGNNANSLTFNEIDGVTYITLHYKKVNGNNLRNKSAEFENLFNAKLNYDSTYRKRLFNS